MVQKNVGFGVSGFEFWYSSFRDPNLGIRELGFEFGSSSLGTRVWVLEFGYSSFGIRVSTYLPFMPDLGSEFGYSSLGIRVWVFEFGYSSLGIRVLGSESRRLAPKCPIIGIPPYL
jgi:hypothetical protein